LRGITIRRFVAYYAIFSISMILMAGVSGLMIFFGIFLISMILLPIIFAQVLSANTKKSDELFESPVIWQGFAVLGLITFVFLVGSSVYILTKGGGADAAYTLAISAIVIAFSIQMLRSARKRKKLWRMIKQAKRVWCPVCGTRVPNSVGICSSCGAIVFWVPSLSDNQRMQILAYLRQRSLNLNTPFDTNET
jgi:hypothetical protein